jgi:hypothetical protein
MEHRGEVYDELQVVCPPHTTERKLVSRIDYRLMPFVIIMYLLAFLDRVNIANAKTFSLVADLNLTGTEYNTGSYSSPHIITAVTSTATQTNPLGSFDHVLHTIRLLRDS